MHLTPSQNAVPAASTSIRIEGRVRRSRGSVDRQTAQSQPMAGTPCEVPLPRTVTLIDGGDRLLSIDRSYLVGSLHTHGSVAVPAAESPYSTSRFDDELPGVPGVHKPHAKLVEHLLQDLTLLRRQIPARLLIQQAEDFDHLRSAVE